MINAAGVLLVKQETVGVDGPEWFCGAGKGQSSEERERERKKEKEKNTNRTNRSRTEKIRSFRLFVIIKKS